MKQSFLLLCYVLSLSVKSQVNPKDTVFIYKDSLLGLSQSIYYDNNMKSKFYDYISDFNFQEPSDSRTYKYSMDYLKKNNLTLTQKTPIIPWLEWITVKQFKSKFYAYCPCDFYYHYKVAINDTTYIDWTGEGPIANQIIIQKKIDNKTYKLKLKDIFYKNRELIIHIIDSTKGVAIFEEMSKKNAKRYYLMIAIDKLKSIPLIVNNCETYKQFELDFDKPNFEKLLKEK
jgi:hypothetical protein